MKIFPACFPALAILTLSSCVQTTTSDLSSQKTVLLHTLEIDNDGKARANLEGKPLFTGNAVETFEQSPTKSVSSWKSGKRHGVTTSYFLMVISDKLRIMWMDLKKDHQSSSNFW